MMNLIVVAALACNIAALSPAERKHHEALTHKVFSAVVSRSQATNGYTFRLDRKRVSMGEIGEWITLEERCCSFFDFRLDLGHENGPLTLTLSGPASVRAFIEAELKSAGGTP
jgi:hypothetical protein